MSLVGKAWRNYFRMADNTPIFQIARMDGWRHRPHTCNMGLSDEERAAKIEAGRRRIETNNEAWLAWSELAAALSVDELLVGKVILGDQADFARKIIAQQLHIMLLSGRIPPN